MNRVSIMGELTASIAHEINQPLTVIVSNANACARMLSTASRRTSMRFRLAVAISLVRAQGFGRFLRIHWPTSKILRRRNLR